MPKTKLIGAFRALGDPNGMRILLLLRDEGPLAVGEIVAALRSPPVSQPSVSKAVKNLREQKLIRPVTNGSRTRYEVDSAEVERVTALFQKMFPRGEELPGALEGES